MSMTDFGDPVAVTELPPPSARGGKPSSLPGLLAWLNKVNAGNPGTYVLASKDADEAHPVQRGTQLRGLVADPANNLNGITIETRAVQSGKRYKIYATKPAPETPAKAGAKK